MNKETKALIQKLWEEGQFFLRIPDNTWPPDLVGTFDPGIIEDGIMRGIKWSKKELRLLQEAEVE